MARFDGEANQAWLWGQGFQPQVPSFRDVHGVDAGLVTAVDLVRGIGVLSGMKICDIPGATGWYDTDFEGKRDVALAELEAGLDLFVIHVEATDEAGLGVWAITHFSRLLEVLEPDQVHVLARGRIHTSGGPELAERLEAEGYVGVLGETGTPVDLPIGITHQAGFGDDPFVDPLA